MAKPKPTAPAKPLTRGERVIAFIHKFCLIPEGSGVGKPVKLLPFQKKFILDVYDNPNGTARAYLSIARKNGKTGLIACILLAHIVGPEAYENSSIMSGARSRKQAAQVFNYAAKMLYMQPAFKGLFHVVNSQKTIRGLKKNVEYYASSAEAKTAHGGSPILAILDEVGQVKGPTDSFVESVETSQGAYEGLSLLIAISTQAATDNDMFSRWLDDAETSKDPRIVSHVYAAPDDCELTDEAAWLAANPALGAFRSRTDIVDMAARAEREPTVEPSFRWLFLNQRIDASAPFVAPSVWRACDSPVLDSFDGLPVYGGLDLSAVSDLTALVLIAPVDAAGKRVWHVKPTFWLPGESIRDRAKADRVPYDVWEAGGHINKTPGKTVEYEFVAAHLRNLFDTMDIRKIAFDRWNFQYLKPWLQKAGFTDEQLEGDDAVFAQFGQGFASISPALRDLESILLNEKLAHGGQPVLTMCMTNAVVTMDAAGNRKLEKNKARGRIDGAVALTMACGVAGVAMEMAPAVSDPWADENFKLATL